MSARLSTEVPRRVVRSGCKFVGHHQLRSASRGLLNFPRYNMSNYGRCAFCFAGPYVWNSLPEHIRQSLDNLRPTATGLDQLPAWFLRLGAPAFAKPLSYLINLSIATSTVPTQWKVASICPVPKIPNPKENADFRPISITSVLSRVTERLIVRQFLYPCFFCPSTSLDFSDQYAFRPSGIGVNLSIKGGGGSRHEDHRRQKELGAPWRVQSTSL